MPSAATSAAPAKLRPSAVVTATRVAAVFEAGDHGVRHQLDLRHAPAGVEQRVMQVDAVDDDVGMLEARAERRAGRHAHQLVAGEGVAHQHRGRAIGLLHHRVADADAVEAHGRRWGRTGCRSRWRRIPARLRARGSRGRVARAQARWSARQARRRRSGWDRISPTAHPPPIHRRNDTSAAGPGNPPRVTYGATRRCDFKLM